MTDSARSQQSMQDILASIRSIITKGDEQPVEPPRPGTVADAFEKRAPSDLSASPELQELARIVRDGVEDEVLPDKREDDTPAIRAQSAQTLSGTAVRGYEGADKTLEGVVADLLRPMLKSWLDENLPPLVERLVAAEIKKRTRPPG